MLLKINDIVSIKQLQQLDGLDVEFAGIHFNQSGNPVADIDAQTLKDADLDIKIVGIFKNAAVQEILQAVETYNLSAVQLNGEASPFICQQISDEVEVIKSFKVDGLSDKSVDYMIQEYDEVCDYYLFEALPGQQGSEGLEKIRKARIEKPFFLSDGLMNGNLAALDTFEHPDFFCIDFSNLEKQNPGIENLPAILLLKNRFKIQNN